MYTDEYCRRFGARVACGADGRAGTTTTDEPTVRCVRGYVQLYYVLYTAKQTTSAGPGRRSGGEAELSRVALAVARWTLSLDALDAAPAECRDPCLACVPARPRGAESVIYPIIPNG